MNNTDLKIIGLTFLFMALVVGALTIGAIETTASRNETFLRCIQAGQAAEICGKVLK